MIQSSNAEKPNVAQYMPRLKQDSYTGIMYDIVVECLKRLGKTFDHCENCGAETIELDIHHTKYDGATIYDLMLFCHPCNMLGENRNLI